MLIFSRITVKHIELKMAKEGLSSPFFDNGFYSTGITYALIIVHPKLTPSIVDYEAVRRHVRKKDKRLAYIYIISSIALIAITLVLVLVWSFLYGSDV